MMGLENLNVQQTLDKPDSGQRLYRRNPGELSLKLDLIQAEAISSNQFGSETYFLATIRELFFAEIFDKTDLLQLKICLEKQNILDDFTLERIEQDGILIIHPNGAHSINSLNDQTEMIKKAVGFTTYYDTEQSRQLMKVTSFKMQIQVVHEDLEQASLEWTNGMAPITYRLDDSEKDLKMARLIKHTQITILQPKTVYFQAIGEEIDSNLADFLVLMNQLKFELEKQPNPQQINILLDKGIQTVPEMHDLEEYLKTVVGKPIDPRGKRSNTLFKIIQTMEEFGAFLETLENQILSPLNQIRFGCETQNQLDKKQMIPQDLYRIKRIIQSMDDLQEPPLKWQNQIRDIHYPIYGRMLGFVALLIEILTKLDFALDEYFQLGSMTSIVSI